jgi:heptosyltransferase-3
MRILAIQLNQPGDAILTTPALRWLMDEGHEVHALLQPLGAQLLQAMPGLASVEGLPRGSIQFVRDLRRLFRYRRHRFDWAVIFSNCSDRPALWARLSGASRRTGLASQGKSHLDRFGLINDWFQNYSMAVPMPEQHLALAGAPPEAGASLKLEYHPPEPEREWAREWASVRGLAGRDYLLLHAAARWPSKYWPRPNLLDFLQQAHDRYNLPIVITSGRDPFEVDFTSELIARVPVAFQEIGTLTVNQLGALIENSAGFLGVDSMPMHLAAALGRPGVALFGPTDDKTWGPWRSRLAVMRQDCRCLREGLRTCPTGPASQCLASLPGDAVLDKIAAVLGHH